MLADFLAALRIGFINPRASARAFLASEAGLREAAYLTLLAFCITGLTSAVMAQALGATSALSGPEGLSIQLGLHFFQLLAMSVAAHELGAKFGGRATRAQMAVLSGWHLVLQSLIAPVQTLALRAAQTGDGSVLALLLPLSVGLLIWIYACFVAEAHGFARLGPILAATFAGFMLIGWVGLAVLNMLQIAQGQMPAELPGAGGGAPSAGPS